MAKKQKKGALSVFRREKGKLTTATHEYNKALRVLNEFEYNSKPSDYLNPETKKTHAFLKALVSDLDKIRKPLMIEAKASHMRLVEEAKAKKQRNKITHMNATTKAKEIIEKTNTYQGTPNHKTPVDLAAKYYITTEFENAVNRARDEYAKWFCPAMNKKIPQQRRMEIAYAVWDLAQYEYNKWRE